MTGVNATLLDGLDSTAFALTANDLGPDSVGTSELAADSVTSAKVALNYAASTSEAGAAANAELLDGLDS